MQEFKNVTSVSLPNSVPVSQSTVATKKTRKCGFTFPVTATAGEDRMDGIKCE